MKEISPQTIETKAQDLHEKGLERWQIVLELNKVFGGKAVAKWLELETASRIQQE